MLSGYFLLYFVFGATFSFFYNILFYHYNSWSLLGSFYSLLIVKPWILIGEAFFWSAYTGAELDLLIIRGKQRLGFEFKRTLAPDKTRSMQTSLEDLKLSHLYIINPGQETFPLTSHITVIGIEQIESTTF